MLPEPPAAAPPVARHPFRSLRVDEIRGGGGERRGPAGKAGHRDAPVVMPPKHAAQLPGEAPLVTTLRSGNRVTLAAVCPRARALGLAPGMALAQARAQVPGLDMRAADPAGDRADLRRLAMLAARRWSPLVAIESDDLLFIDVTGGAHLFGGERAMAARIVRLLARYGVSARVAIADTPGAAAALARYAPQPMADPPAQPRTGRMRHPRESARLLVRGLRPRPQGDAPQVARVIICPPGGHAQAIAPLPPEALRIDADAVELLRRLGVDTIGALAAMPRGPFVRRFGPQAARRLDQALGALPEPLDPVVPPTVIAIGQRFAEPILTAEAIAHWLGVLVPRLALALEQAGLGARRIELVAERVDHVPQGIAIGLARASRDGAHLKRLLARRIEAIEPGYGIDAITLHVRRAEPLAPHDLAENLDPDAASDLAPLVDALANRGGGVRLWRAEPVESDVPERSVAARPPLGRPPRPAERLRRDDVRRLARSTALPPWHPAWPRPVRLLHRPERLGDVIALMPDHPPRRFTWRGTTHRIVRADGPERVHGEWWKNRAETHGVRDYFRVEDEAGRRFWLFRRGDGERGVTGDLSWFMHGLFG